jgi:hypothetical protein
MANRVVNPTDTDLEGIFGYAAQMVNPEDAYRALGRSVPAPNALGACVPSRTTMLTARYNFETKVVDSQPEEMRIIVAPSLKKMVLSNSFTGGYNVAQRYIAQKVLVPHDTIGAHNFRDTGFATTQATFNIDDPTRVATSTVPLILSTDSNGAPALHTVKTDVDGADGFYVPINHVTPQIGNVTLRISFNHAYVGTAAVMYVNGGAGTPSFDGSDPSLLASSSGTDGHGYDSVTLLPAAWNAIDYLVVGFTTAGHPSSLLRFTLEIDGLDSAFEPEVGTFVARDHVQYQDVRANSDRYHLVSYSALLEYTGTDVSNGGYLAACRVDPHMATDGVDGTAMSFEQINRLPRAYSGPLKKGGYVWWSPGTIQERDRWIPMSGVNDEFATMIAFAVQPQLGLDGHNPTFTLTVQMVIETLVMKQYLSPEIYFSHPLAPAVASLAQQIPWATCNPLHPRLKQLGQYAKVAGKKGVQWLWDNKESILPLLAKGAGLTAAIL